MHTLLYQSKSDKLCVFGGEYIETETQFDDWYNEMRQHPIYVYRGQKEARYKNYTSAQRYYLEKNFGGGNPINIVEEQLRVLKLRFGDVLEKYCESINTSCSDLFLLSLAQHYGGVTPLIDFTSDINIALYFMTIENNDNHPVMKFDNDLSEYSAIYYLGTPFTLSLDKMLGSSSKVLMDGFGMSEEQLQNEFDEICRRVFSYKMLSDVWAQKDILIENKRYLYPVGKHTLSTNISITNLNIIAQSGCFVYHDHTYSPLEKEVSCVNINKSLHKYIRAKYLQGYTEEKVYPIKENSFITTALKDTCRNLQLD